MLVLQAPALGLQLRLALLGRRALQPLRLELLERLRGLLPVLEFPEPLRALPPGRMVLPMRAPRLGSMQLGLTRQNWARLERIRMQRARLDQVRLH